jgi:hypothetical protein
MARFDLFTLQLSPDIYNDEKKTDASTFMSQFLFTEAMLFVKKKRIIFHYYFSFQSKPFFSKATF